MSANITVTAHGTSYQNSPSERDAHREVGAIPQRSRHPLALLSEYSKGRLPQGSTVPGPGNLTQKKGVILALLRIVNHSKGIKGLCKWN